MKVEPDVTMNSATNEHHVELNLHLNPEVAQLEREGEKFQVLSSCYIQPVFKIEKSSTANNSDD